MNLSPRKAAPAQIGAPTVQLGLAIDGRLLILFPSGKEGVPISKDEAGKVLLQLLHKLSGKAAQPKLGPAELGL